MALEFPQREADFPVEGMTCAACAASVEQVLNRLPGVEARVNLAAEQAHVSYDARQIQPGQLLASVRRAGFDVPRRQLVLGVEGMSCSACSTAVERALRQLPEVAADVNLATGEARIDYQPALVSEAELEAAIHRSGYVPFQQARWKDDARQVRTQAESEEWRRARTQAVLASLLTLPLLLPMFSMLLPAGMQLWPEGGLARGWQLLLATPVQFWAGGRFYRAAWRALRGRHANMDVLVVLGTSVAYGYSLVLTLGGLSGDIYFESSAVIICLILWGRLMEARARHRTSAAVRALSGLQPERARVERDGGVVELDVGRILVGDVVQVPAGGQIPVDGQVVSGESSVDESMLSGESMPVAKTAGARVHAASLNGPGLLRVTVTEVGADTLLARMIRRVEQAQGSKAPVQRLADRVADIFVPAVLLVAVLTLLGTWLVTGTFAVAMVHAVAVLVIACPCSLGLATPTAIMVGAGAAARSGIMIRDAEVLERLGRVETMVFDKTGTLTRGCTVIQAIHPAPGHASGQVLEWAASLESGSVHPLARAFVAAAEAAALAPSAPLALQSIAGQGLEAVMPAGRMRLGRLAWALDGAPVPAWAATLAADEPMARVALVVNGGLAACFDISDALRDDARQTVSTLRKMGLRTLMLTGDGTGVAARIAAASGIDAYVAEVLPEGKADHLLQWRRSHSGPVAMVGDGINDAPALAVADVGIAMGGGTMAAIEAAGVVLMQDRLMAVARAVTLSRATLRVIRQNLFFAFGYNVVCIPLAALGWLNPMLAGAMMALSSISVVGNSLRLGRYGQAGWGGKRPA